MCGIVGFIKGRSFVDGGFNTQTIVEKMSSQIVNRGPDSAGLWINNDAQVAFGHLRLSILDLTDNGHQPMISKSGRYVIVFNGEIYNHLELRQKIPLSYKGKSDTETLLAAIEVWGIRRALDQIEGMFAFAVFDNLKKELILARDRVGEKPLYYGWQGKGLDRVFIFGSELKALRAHPGFENKLDSNSVHLYLKYSNVPAPYSIYEGVYKLCPGEFAVLSIHTEEIKIEKYWNLIDLIGTRDVSRFNGSASDASKILEHIISEAIGRQLISDVPLGLFLSGGIDSSLVAALAQSRMDKPLNSFAIGFTEDAYNEAHYAKAVAKYLKTNHHEMYVSPSDALSVIPKLSTIYDEPFADSSQIPMVMVSQLARSKVTVALSGDGGDELFGGYNRYRANNGVLKSIKLLPLGLRKMVAKAISSISAERWNAIEREMVALLPNRFGYSNIAEKMHKVAIFIESNSAIDAYDKLSSNWTNATKIVNNEIHSSIAFSAQLNDLGLSNAEVMMAMDMLNYLPNDILTKVDRASMSASLEVRAPFLDINVINFAWKLPQSLKINGSDTKWILRDILRRYVPSYLTDRPKMGFGIPLGGWLRGPLRGWAEDLLSQKKIKSYGLFSEEEIGLIWKSHLEGKSGLQNKIWAILMFQSWIDTQTK